MVIETKTKKKTKESNKKNGPFEKFYNNQVILNQIYQDFCKAFFASNVFCA